MPLINFKIADKVALGYKQAKKVCIGYELVWEEEKKRLLKTIKISPLTSGEVFNPSEVEVFTNRGENLLEGTTITPIKEGRIGYRSVLVDGNLRGDKVEFDSLEISEPLENADSIYFWNVEKFRGFITLEFTNGDSQRFYVDHVLKGEKIGHQIHLKLNDGSTQAQPTDPPAEKSISTKVPYTVPDYTSYIDINRLSEEIDLSSVKRIVIGSKWTIDKADIKSLGRNVIVLKNTVGSVTGGKEINGGTTATIYYG